MGSLGLGHFAFHPPNQWPKRPKILGTTPRVFLRVGRVTVWPCEKQERVSLNHHFLFFLRKFKVSGGAQESLCSSSHRPRFASQRCHSVGLFKVSSLHVCVCVCVCVCVFVCVFVARCFVSIHVVALFAFCVFSVPVVSFVHEHLSAHHEVSLSVT